MGPGSRATTAPTRGTAGAYLVNAVGHCGECHTERSWLGRSRRGRALAGSREPPEPSPNLTLHPEEGLGTWTFGDMITFLELGMTPDGDFVGAGMHDVVELGTATLSEADRRDVALYLRSLPARRSLGPDRGREPSRDDEEEWF